MLLMCVALCGVVLCDVGVLCGCVRVVVVLLYCLWCVVLRCVVLCFVSICLLFNNVPWRCFVVFGVLLCVVLIVWCVEFVVCVVFCCIMCLSVFCYVCLRL